MTTRGLEETLVLDARWLGFTGIGRMTNLLIDGLREIEPAGRWIVWGPASLRNRLWSGAEFVEAIHSPIAGFGQRDLFRVPKGRYVSLHIVRPLVARRSTLLVAHDTIPVRWVTPRVVRWMKHLFYAVSVHGAEQVLVYSDTTAERLRRDLRLGGDRVARFDLSIDPRVASNVRQKRQAGSARADRLLYVGLHEPHKNLARAIAGFRASKFAQGGATFQLVGAADDTLDDLRRLAAQPGAGAVEVLPRCSDDDLARLYADATAVIQPSLDEGLGLTVIEALAAGIPTCCTEGGALAEASCGAAVTFDGQSVDSIAKAIDETVALIESGGWHERFEQFHRLRPQPTPRDMAERFLSIVAPDRLPSALAQVAQ
jgi:glycosyltransferase involved in cell wall biosynthesis